MEHEITKESVMAETDLQKLSDWRTDIWGIIQALDGKINHAKAKAFGTGDYSDPDWFRRITGKRAAMGYLCNLINQRVSDLTRAAKAERSRSYQQAFIDIARAELDAATFARISAMAQDRADNLTPTGRK